MAPVPPGLAVKLTVTAAALDELTGPLLLAVGDKPPGLVRLTVAVAVQLSPLPVCVTVTV